MKTRSSFRLVVAAGVLAAASCGGDPAPTAPSLVPAAGAPPAADAGGGSPAAPPARQADLRPAARADVRGLQPGQWTHGDFNAYDFEASWDGSMLHLALIEDEMRSMREGSKPHRNRLITVGTCPVEPHHALQSCGAPIWSGTRRLAGRLELPPIPLAECAGWLVVNAAELSDDRYDGWRNGPCPDPDDETGVGSDGSGEGWPEYPEPESGASPTAPGSGAPPTDPTDPTDPGGGAPPTDPPAPANNAPVITNPGDKTYDRGAAITAFGITANDADGDTVTLGVSGLPTGLSWSSGQVSGTVDASATVQTYTVTVTANDGVGAAVTLDFEIKVLHRIPVSAGNTIQSPLGPAGSSLLTMGPAQTSAQQAFNSNPPAGWTSALSATTSSALAVTDASTVCTGLSLSLVSGSVFVGTFSWAYGANQVTPPAHQYRARRVHPWAARCE